MAGGWGLAGAASALGWASWAWAFGAVVEARVKSVGPLEPFLHQLVGGLRAGMKYVGAATVEDLRTKSTFVRISGAGLRESHPHDVRITTEPPNYRIKA